MNELSMWDRQDRVNQTATQRIQELGKLIEELERHKNYQIDENRKISQRVDILEEAHDSRLIELETAISNLGVSKPLKKEKTEGLTFGEALEHLKNGKNIGRWHNDNIHVYLNQNRELRVNTVNDDDCPWQPNHTELLCEDWRVIE